MKPNLNGGPRRGPHRRARSPPRPFHERSTEEDTVTHRTRPTRCTAVIRPGLAPVLALALALALVPAAAAQPELPGNPAMNDPDHFAWQLFAVVNRPATDDGETAQWETWAEQSVVYASCGRPEWPGDGVGPFHGQPSQLVSILKARGVNADSFNAITGEQNVQQVKINRAFFDYVVDHDLWYQEGVIRAASTGGIDLPEEAIVFKADWKEISEQDKPRYHWRLVSREEYDAALGIQSDGGSGDQPPVLLGLYAFHIVSKALDTWVWTTWNQADTPGRCDYIGCRDTFGSDPAYIPPHREMGQPYDPGKLTPRALRLLEEAGLGDELRHYRLMGTMVTYTDAAGRPNLLGNAELEPTFGNSSSCMTCHAMASFSAAGSNLDFLKSTQPLQGFVGTPDPDWFYAPSSAPARPLVYRTDFMWQLASTKPRDSLCQPPSGAAMASH